MEDFNQIIEALGVKHIDAKNVDVLESTKVQNYHDIANTLILANEADIYFGKDEKKLNKGDFLFIPSGCKTSLKFGESTKQFVTTSSISKELEPFLKMEDVSSIHQGFAYMTFDTKVFDAVNFFLSLDIPPFVISENSRISTLIQSLILEADSNHPGKDRMIMTLSDQVVIEIMRYIDEHHLFMEQFATNMTYFKDPRLLDIFTYIKENLRGDLSNKALAEIANVSEDYVGQYFKMLTGINPQDYIEYQRMEKAVALLRTSKRSIREIGHDVGYKDTAYFCRRFKMMFGLSAGKMRRRESAVNP